MAGVPDTISIAIALQEAGHVQLAAEIYRKVLAETPNNARAWYLLGVVSTQLGDRNDAIGYIEHALQLMPGLAEAHTALGSLLQSQGALDKAIACHRRALQLNSTLAEGHFNLGNAFAAQGKADDAIDSYRRAVEIRPNYWKALNNLGIALRKQGSFDDAAVALRRAIELKPDFAEAHSNLGNALHDQDRIDEAAACYRRAIELCPDYAGAHANLSTLMLLSGDLESGWLEYEWRWRTGDLSGRVFAQPRWQGEPLNERTVLLWAEQGFGDTFQFVRYAQLVRALGATVIVECQRPLAKLLSRCPGIDRLVAERDELPEFDFQIRLLSLPGIFKTTLISIPVNVPYLFADPALIELWRQKLGSVEAALVGSAHPTKAFRVGINWAGRAGPGPHTKRDVPVEHFAGLAAVPGVRLMSLQKGADPSLTHRASVVDFGEELDAAHGAFMDTAAIMMNLDLVITSDTSVAHLAGALGVPVWVALPLVPDWRWMLERSDSPWYPTMRLFRQKTRGDWAGVFAEIEAALRERVSSTLK